MGKVYMHIYIVFLFISIYHSLSLKIIFTHIFLILFNRIAGSNFEVRGPEYFKSQIKVPSENPVCAAVGVQIYKSSNLIDSIIEAPEGIEALNR